MVNVRIECKSEFRIYGRRTWVEQDNEMFGQFWEKCRQEGLTELFRNSLNNLEDTVTNSYAIGVSRVEKDPANRSFWFYVATESEQAPEGWGLEEYTVPASMWAIFDNYGETVDALIEAELYAFEEWLPNSPYVHANVPEIEAYPPSKIDEVNCYEFWLPIKENFND
ncbi:GyrI-like domain-containing protein [Paenibacillus tritici]|uniref:GyrI-like domain-containing protein n=1 Tax=Paenibacillus tritici TaxID=1873425 RepID=UPI001BA8F4B8|nr:GyrI-like domain-containing protein [Paenibacillus tritici]QUL55207.1 GyrI-like domain-containing protein [Paenibacillus tritici]